MMRWATVILLGATVAACDDGGKDGSSSSASAAPRVVEQSTAIYKKATDLLLVIDNSGSMCQEQRSIAQALANLAQHISETGADVRVAVVTTDMQDPEQSGHFRSQATPAVAALNCRDENDNPLVPDTEGCPDDLPLILMPGQDTETLERHLRCVTQPGTGGDGFEKGLEAMRTSLSCDGPNHDAFAACCTDDGFDPNCTASVDFLRPGAQLLVFVLSDENDCSAPADNPAASSRVICRTSGRLEDYAAAPECEGMSAQECFADECGELDSESCRLNRCVIGRRDNSNCEWSRGSLVPIAEYSQFLAGLKPDGLAQVAFVPLVGSEAFTEMGFPVRFNPGEAAPQCEDDAAPSDECCPQGQCRSQIQISCESSQGAAFSGWRYRQLASALGTCDRTQANDALCPSICGDAFQETTTTLINLIDGYGKARCLDTAPACRILEPTPRACTDLESFVPGNYPVEATFQCSDCGEISAEDAVSVQFDRRCESGFRVQFADTLPTGAQVILRYEAEFRTHRPSLQ